MAIFLQVINSYLSVHGSNDESENFSSTDPVASKLNRTWASPDTTTRT